MSVLCIYVSMGCIAFLEVYRYINCTLDFLLLSFRLLFFLLCESYCRSWTTCGLVALLFSCVVVVVMMQFCLAVSAVKIFGGKIFYLDTSVDRIITTSHYLIITSFMRLIVH